jgi:hypothetical protein
MITRAERQQIVDALLKLRRSTWRSPHDPDRLAVLDDYREKIEDGIGRGHWTAAYTLDVLDVMVDTAHWWPVWADVRKELLEPPRRVRP